MNLIHLNHKTYNQVIDTIDPRCKGQIGVEEVPLNPNFPYFNFYLKPHKNTPPFFFGMGGWKYKTTSHLA